jgi:hypothetical protein
MVLRKPGWKKRNGEEGGGKEESDVEGIVK